MITASGLSVMAGAPLHTGALAAGGIEGDRGLFNWVAVA